MLPAGRPSLGLGSSESAVSTEPKNAPLISASRRTFSENWRGRRHSGRAWSEETTKTGVYLGVFGSDRKQ